MKIEERLKEIILFETNIDVTKNSRKREVIEIRALYFKLLKEYNTTLSLEYIGNTVDKNHATVIHSLKKYDMYEKYNSDLKELRKLIAFKIDSENILNLNDNDSLKLEVKKLQHKLIELDLIHQEIVIGLKQKSVYEYKIINDLNELMNQTKGTDKHNLIQIRLDAFYHMNKIKPETWYDEQKEERMNIIGQNGNEGTHYGKV